ncbi:MAG: hypothetical protein D6741_06895 [Planctomycetota bacterium]|nr:MAG: hypothetical protein D6741_06895 [Planctomycetota bacterium]
MLQAGPRLSIQKRSSTPARIRERSRDTRLFAGIILRLVPASPKRGKFCPKSAPNIAPERYNEIVTRMPGYGANEPDDGSHFERSAGPTR